jgi:hypothetical protein
MSYMVLGFDSRLVLREPERLHLAPSSSVDNLALVVVLLTSL